MRLFRTLLLSLLVVAAGGFLAPAGVSYAVDKPARTYQGMCDQDCNNCDAATACVSCSIGCTHGAIPSATTAHADDPAGGDLTAHSAAPISSLALAPEEAPPKRSII